MNGTVTIHARLGRLMGERGLTIAELAKLSRLSYATVAQLYRGEAKRFDASTLNALCKTLNVQPGDLLEYVPDDEAGR
jgi:putative transcriptional regulator